MSKVFRVTPNVLFKICPNLFSEALFELITVKCFSYIQKNYATNVKSLVLLREFIH